MIHLPNIARSLWLRLLMVAALSIATDYFLLYPGFAQGSVAGVYSLSILAVLLVCNPGIYRHRQGQTTCLLTIIQSCLLLWDFSWLSFGLTYAGIILMANMRRGPLPTDATIWARRIIGFGLKILGPLVHLLTQFHKTKKRHTHARRPIFLRGTINEFIFPLLGSMVFIWLFSTINPYINRLLNSISLWPDLSLSGFGRILGIVGMGCIFLALLRPKPVRQRTPRHLLATGKMKSSALLTPGSMIAGLLLFNMIFGLQTASDLAYMFNKELTTGHNFASTAQNAAHILLVAALLAAGIILRARTYDLHRIRPIARLIYVWIAQNIILLVLAIRHLYVYISVFDLTLMRFAAFVWMMIVALGFVWIIQTLRRHKTTRWLININSLTVLAFLYTLSFVDVGGVIARYNLQQAVHRSTSEHQLDIDYLKMNIGIAALPALRDYEAKFPCHKRTDIIAAQSYLLSDLQQNILEWRHWSVGKALMLRQSMRTAAPTDCPHATFPTLPGRYDE